MDRQLGDIRPATEPDDEAALPRFELDRPLVLLAGAVLREQAREVAVIDPEHPRRAAVSHDAADPALREDTPEERLGVGDAAARRAAWARCGRRRGTARAAPRSRRLPVRAAAWAASSASKACAAERRAPGPSANGGPSCAQPGAAGRPRNRSRPRRSVRAPHREAPGHA